MFRTHGPGSYSRHQKLSRSEQMPLYLWAYGQRFFSQEPFSELLSSLAVRISSAPYVSSEAACRWVFPVTRQ